MLSLLFAYEILKGIIQMPQFNPQIVVDKAQAYGLSPSIVAAVIHQESSGRPFVTRWEPGYHRRYIEPLSREQLPNPSKHITTETEKIMLSMSWGLMQLMGYTSKFYAGFEGEIPTTLNPETNVELGCRYLQYLIKRSMTRRPDAPMRDHYMKALTRYNGSSKYPPKILAHLKSGVYRRHLPEEYNETNKPFNF